ncbi:MAG: glycine--tRNA ligase [Firmicutes bacterium]|nr:glycine--tRNA ligase [Bacillota bacterium]MCL1954157.1 glycine--tRNA ligase [Bacillota bacterium]
MNNNVTMDKLTALCKGRGFIFAGSDIYGGLANSWDYGPLGVELKNNIKTAWYKKFVQQDRNNIGLDSAIIMNSQVWHSSGHLGGFSDPLMDCKNCKTRHRADSLIEDYANRKQKELPDLTNDTAMQEYIAQNKVPCPNCGNSDFTNIRKFNLMFKTFIGPSEDSANTAYLRPETAQGIFVNFKNLVRVNRNKLPFGVGQIGKSFRNEITPGNYIFRTREFEQMELEFFCKPGTDMEWFEYYRQFCANWLTSLGINPENMRIRDHEKEELSHYSTATSDIEYKFPFGWGELWGIANRTDYDLKAHSRNDGDMDYIDTLTNERFVPYVIEPSLGADRVLLAFLCNAYHEETLENGEQRIVLKLHNALAPYKCAVLPLQKNPELVAIAQKIHDRLSLRHSVTYDETASIGKRYRRQDEIGTPMCITVDFDSLTDKMVTLRDRDTMTQRRIKISQIGSTITRKTKF